MESTKTIAFLLLLMLTFGCKEKPNIEIVTKKSKAEVELEKIKKDLEEIGEIGILDTSLNSKILCFGDSNLNGNFVYSLKKTKNSNILISSISKFKYKPDFNLEVKVKDSNQYKIQDLIKITKQQNDSNSSKIFNYFDSLKTIALKPMNYSKNHFPPFEAINGRYWVIYFDGKKIYYYCSNSYYVKPDRIYDILDLDSNFKNLMEIINCSHF